MYETLIMMACAYSKFQTEFLQLKIIIIFL